MVYFYIDILYVVGIFRATLIFRLDRSAFLARCIYMESVVKNPASKIFCSRGTCNLYFYKLYDYKIID